MRAYTGVRKCPFHNLALESIQKRQEVQRLVTSNILGWSSLRELESRSSAADQI